MNRAQKRQQKKKKPSVGAMVNAELDTLREDLHASTLLVVRDVVDTYSIALAHVLHDKYGFGQTRVRRLLEEVNSLCDSITQEYVDIIDIRQAVIDDLGIIIGDDSDYTRKVDTENV